MSALSVDSVRNGSLAANDAWLPLVGRVLLVLLFLISGFNKIGGSEQVAGYMANKGGLPAAGLLVWLVIVLEIGAAAAIIVGWQTRLAALALAAFTLLATFLFHDFWNLQGAERYVQHLHFWKNLSVTGGLLLLAGFGPGRLSLDARRG